MAPNLARIVQRFVVSTLAEAKCHRAGNARVGNRHAKKVVAAWQELCSIGDDGRQALATLLADSRPEVRTSAAVFLLRYCTDDALRVLRAQARERGMLGFGAGEAIKRWNEGVWDLDPGCAVESASAACGSDRPPQPVTDDAPNRPRSTSETSARRSRGARGDQRSARSVHNDVASRRRDPQREPRAGASSRVEGVVRGLRVPAVHLMRSDCTSGRSHFGGSPRLPANLKWPRWHGERLRFLARVSLAEAQATQSLGWLPQTGALLFFYSEAEPWGFQPADRGSCVVYYVPDLPHPVRRARRTSTSKFPAMAYMGLRAIATLPPAERAPDLAQSDGDLVEYEQLVDAPYAQWPKHQLGGVPQVIQDDTMALECHLASNGIDLERVDPAKDRRAKALASGAKDWRLLLQLDTEPELDFMWGDGGMIYIWVKEAEASRGDFSSAWLVLQTS